MTLSVVIGLSAVIVAIDDGEAVVLTVRPGGAPASLPFGPFDPQVRTFELALRAFVSDQTRLDLGYVEQLYTFGRCGRGRRAGGVGGLSGPAARCGCDGRTGYGLGVLDAVLSVGGLAGGPAGGDR